MNFKIWLEGSMIDVSDFKNWFNGSKVIDSEGNPIVVYHQTSKESAVKIKKFGFDPKKSAMGGIFWVTSDKSAIDKNETGAGSSGAVIELYASIKNPAGWEEYDKKGLDELIRDGYDGVILREKDGTFNAIVFDPKQLKEIHIPSARKPFVSIGRKEFKSAVEDTPSSSAFNDMFGDDFFDVEDYERKIKERGKVVSTKREYEKGELILYHGFTKAARSFNYEFDPSKSEQGLLWFTHNMISMYDPYEYAANRGKYVLTYKLPIQKVSDIVTYENGSNERKASQDLVNQYDGTSNSNMLPLRDSVIVLPKNWFFTYKNEKFIGTTKKLKVNPNMISLSVRSTV